MLRFITALEAEARPIIDHYRLRRETEFDAFRIYRQGKVMLAVSGVGKTAAAAAVSFLHLAAGGDRQAVWLNVGIGGHGTRRVGEMVLAHKITDHGSGRSWFPPLVAPVKIATSAVLTVDRVECRFEEPVVYEMEASGFYATSCRFSTGELVQCLKIISDGPAEHAERLSATDVEKLVKARIEEIAKIAQALEILALEVRQGEVWRSEAEGLTSNRRFSFTERRMLRRLIERWNVLQPGVPLPREAFATKHGSEILQQLEVALDEMPRTIGESDSSER